MEIAARTFSRYFFSSSSRNFFVHATNDVFHFGAACFETFTEIDNRESSELRSEKRAKNFDFAFFDSLGDLNFAFASEKRNASHFLQIKFYRISAASKISGSGSFFAVFFSRCRSGWHQRSFFTFFFVFRIFRTLRESMTSISFSERRFMISSIASDVMNLRRQEFIHFFVSEVSALDTHIEKLLDFFILSLNGCIPLSDFLRGQEWRP